MDDAETASQGGASTSAGMPRVPSTAATAAAAAAAAGGAAAVAGWEADGAGVAAEGWEEGEEPPHKRHRKGLTVHFAEDAADQPSAPEPAQQQQQASPTG